MSEPTTSATTISPSDAPAYRNPKLPISERVNDLLSRMTLREKAGQMFHDMILPNRDGTLSTPPSAAAFGIPSIESLILNHSSSSPGEGGKNMTHFNILGPITSPRTLARWHNALQTFA